MYITGWTVLLSALGAIPAVWVQERMFAWIWVLGVVLLALFDAALAPRPTDVGVRRETPRAVQSANATGACGTIPGAELPAARRARYRAPASRHDCTGDDST